MLTNAFETESFKHIILLNKSQQSKVLAYIKTLVKRPSANQELLQFAGAINPKDIQEMMVAIEARCENIDKAEW